MTLKDGCIIARIALIKYYSEEYDKNASYLTFLKEVMNTKNKVNILTICAKYIPFC